MTEIGKKEKYKRYIPVEQSIIESLKEVREMQAGRLPKKTWRQFFAELEDEERKEKIQAKKNKLKGGD